MSNTTIGLIAFGFGLATSATWTLWHMAGKLDRIIVVLEDLRKALRVGDPRDPE